MLNLESLDPDKAMRKFDPLHIKQVNGTVDTYLSRQVNYDIDEGTEYAFEPGLARFSAVVLTN